MTLKRQHHAKEFMILIAHTATRERIGGQRIKPAPQWSSMIPEVDVEAGRMTILRVALDLDLERCGEPGGDVDVAGCEVGIGDWVGIADLLAGVIPDPDGCLVGGQFMVKAEKEGVWRKEGSVRRNLQSSGIWK